MKAAFISICVLSCALFLPAWGTDGYSVTAVGRWTCGGNIPENAFGYQWKGDDTDNDLPGHILRATIRADAVASLDTIYNQTYAKYPVINLSGTKVAMYRYEARLQNGAVVDLDKPRHISVMNIDGSNLRDLATFSAADVAGGGEYFIILDWTVGDWIYYTMPRHKSPNDSCPIWRVQADNASSNQHVYTYNPQGWANFARWDITADGKRSSLMGNWTDGYSNTCTDFPPTHAPVPAGMTGGYYANVCCCNISCSASGRYVTRFIDGGHVNVFLGRWAPNDLLSVKDLNTVPLTSISAWAKENVGAGMGMTHWSTNSDKWYCVMPAGCREVNCGGNQVLVNHLDQKAIMTTHNRNLPGVECQSAIVVAATAGDFWVKPPAGSEGKIEDTLGNWVTVNTNTEIGKGPGRGLIPANSRPRLCRLTDGTIDFTPGGREEYRIELCTADGRRLQSFRGTGGRSTIPQSVMRPGIVFARIVAENTGKTETVPLCVP
jgi:hypothetical protein